MSKSGKLPVRCPKCHSADVRLSHTEGPWDVFLSFFFSRDAYRCRSCRARFHKLDPGDDEEEILEIDKRAPAER